MAEGRGDNKTVCHHNRPKQAARKGTREREVGSLGVTWQRMHLKARDTRHCLLSLISLCSCPLNPFELIPDYIFVPLSSFTFTDLSEVVILELGAGGDWDRDS